MFKQLKYPKTLDQRFDGAYCEKYVENCFGIAGKYASASDMMLHANEIPRVNGLWQIGYFDLVGEYAPYGDTFIIAPNGTIHHNDGHFENIYVFEKHMGINEPHGLKYLDGIGDFKIIGLNKEIDMRKIITIKDEGKRVWVSDHFYGNYTHPDEVEADKRFGFAEEAGEIDRPWFERLKGTRKAIWEI